MRFQIVFAMLATYVATAMAGACEDCQRTCPRPSEDECSKLTLCFPVRFVTRKVDEPLEQTRFAPRSATLKKATLTTMFLSD